MIYLLLFAIVQSYEALVELIVVLDPSFIDNFQCTKETKNHWRCLEAYRQSKQILSKMDQIFQKQKWDFNIRIAEKTTLFIWEHSKATIPAPTYQCEPDEDMQSKCGVTVEYLWDFEEYMKQFYQYDHAMLFTFHEFAGGASGVGMPGTMCSSRSQSVARMSLKSTEISGLVGAQMLGIAFSAQHDGVENTCCSRENPCRPQEYIMTRKNIIDHPPQEKFSQCSIRSISLFLKTTHLQCLAKNGYNDVPTIYTFYPSRNPSLPPTTFANRNNVNTSLHPEINETDAKGLIWREKPELRIGVFFGVGFISIILIICFLQARREKREHDYYLHECESESSWRHYESSRHVPALTRSDCSVPSTLRSSKRKSLIEANFGYHIGHPNIYYQPQRRESLKTRAPTPFAHSGHQKSRPSVSTSDTTDTDKKIQVRPSAREATV